MSEFELSELEFGVLSQVQFLGFITIQVFEFWCYLSWWVLLLFELSQFQFFHKMSFELSQFEFLHFATIWVEFCCYLSFKVLSQFEFFLALSQFEFLSIFFLTIWGFLQFKFLTRVEKGFWKTYLKYNFFLLHVGQEQDRARSPL